LRGTALFLGGAIALVAVPALYLLAGAPSAAEIISLSNGGARVTPGFVGTANFGQWRLICVPGPARAGVLGADKTTASTNSCRVNQEMPSPRNAATSTTSVIVAANFRLVGPKRSPAAMLRLPVTARAGDPVGLQFEDGAVVQTLVRDCGAAECVAAGTLTQADWDHLSTATSLQVRFPATGRQWALLDLPLQGLSAAIAALERAEISPPS